MDKLTDELAGFLENLTKVLETEPSAKRLQRAIDLTKDFSLKLRKLSQERSTAPKAPPSPQHPQPNEAVQMELTRASEAAKAWDTLLAVAEEKVGENLSPEQDNAKLGKDDDD